MPPLPAARFEASACTMALSVAPVVSPDGGGTTPPPVPNRLAVQSCGPIHPGGVDWINGIGGLPGTVNLRWRHLPAADHALQRVLYVAAVFPRRSHQIPACLARVRPGLEGTAAFAADQRLRKPRAFRLAFMIADVGRSQHLEDLKFADQGTGPVLVDWLAGGDSAQQVVHIHFMPFSAFGLPPFLCMIRNITIRAPPPSSSSVVALPEPGLGFGPVLPIDPPAPRTDPGSLTVLLVMLPVVPVVDVPPGTGLPAGGNDFSLTPLRNGVSGPVWILNRGPGPRSFGSLTGGRRSPPCPPPAIGVPRMGPGVRCGGVGAGGTDTWPFTGCIAEIPFTP